MFSTAKRRSYGSVFTAHDFATLSEDDDDFTAPVSTFAAAPIWGKPSHVAGQSDGRAEWLGRSVAIADSRSGHVAAERLESGDWPIARQLSRQSSRRCLAVYQSLAVYTRERTPDV